jgi:hypothetical protein
MLKMPTPSMKSALLWLRRRNGDGMFGRDGVLVAAGERAPVMRATWNRLCMEKFTEEYEGRKRLRITEAGKRLNLTGIIESGDDPY